jgi:hypothetical protein
VGQSGDGAVGTERQGAGTSARAGSDPCDLRWSRRHGHLLLFDPVVDGTHPGVVRRRRVILTGIAGSGRHAARQTHDVSRQLLLLAGAVAEDCCVGVTCVQLGVR